jgi:hypothetical protein
MAATDGVVSAPPVRPDRETQARRPCHVNGMSSTQLDILALEPFYGGVRRVMLDQVIHCSRHRWTLLKLPPRRIERRLTAAAHWFAEQLSRHWVGRVDMLFTSEALNLSDLYRLVPGLLKKPAVVYFHANQLPPPQARQEGPLDLVNLNTAAAATEIWFNSMYHLRSFFERVGAMVGRMPDLAAHDPLPELTSKVQIMPPPVGTNLIQKVAQEPGAPARERRTIFVETRDADNQLLNKALERLVRRNERFKLITVGPVEDLNPELPRQTLPESDERAHVAGMLQSGIFVSTKREATVDHHAIRALLSGCWPLVPADGVYREMIPDGLHKACLHDGSPEDLAGRIQDLWHLGGLQAGHEQEMQKILHRFDPIPACRAFDERLEELAVAHSISGGK